MKFLIAFATLALFAVINANPYGGGNRGYGGGYGGYGGGRLVYVQEPSYGQGGYGGRGYSQPLYSSNSNARAAAAASASNGSIRPGNYRQLAVQGLEIDGSYNAPSRGYGSGYGRGGY